MSARHRPFAPTVALAGLWLACAAAPAAAQALYKLVAPDGAVTYTDRPPAGGNLRVESLGRTEGGAGSPALPQALREAAARFPVVLYTLPDCAPCDRGRDLLRSRGVPHEERRADPAADRDAWLRAVGSLDAPALTVGAQALRGFAAEEWNATLDLAGYPRTSRLPANYAPPEVQPLVARRTVPAPAAEPQTPVEPLPRPSLPLPAGGGIRF
ncbi:MAG: glutaredoxin family protein [Gammaproteobacteria bacterium]|uniref:glutaredoxin family protein n=1 Tax=Azohydromonas sp. TaxID=1872666 RepID=UPI002D0D89C8|nr:glutaredoxin family protein [Azohydromonas sp.]HMM85130.1 glutaredoxin family protein [Azohydromonas sp.]